MKGKKQINSLAAVLPMYEAFKKLEGILDEALGLLRVGIELTEMDDEFNEAGTDSWVWLHQASGFVKAHEKRDSGAAKIAVGKQP